MPLVIEYLNKKDWFKSSKNKVFAYWVNQIDEETKEHCFVEDYDDDGEDGMGEKLLHLL